MLLIIDVVLKVGVFKYTHNHYHFIANPADRYLYDFVNCGDPTPTPFTPWGNFTCKTGPILFLTKLYLDRCILSPVPGSSPK